MAETSKYIQINDWCLIEYIYDTDVNFSQDDVKTYRVENSLTGEYSFIASNDATDTGYNFATFGKSVVPVNKNKSLWSPTDFDQDDETEVNIWDYPYVSGDDMSNISGALVYDNIDIPSNLKNIYFDKIRIHILTGYYLDGLDGIALETVFKEKTTKNFPSSTFYYSKSVDENADDLIFATSPLIMSQKSYDKYIEFYVPSLSNIQYEFEKASTTDKTKDFAYYYSHSVSDNTEPGGYVHDGPIYINFYELSDSFVKNGCTFFYVKNRYTTSIKMSDNYAKLACHIEQSSEGDYFEYYPTWDGTYIKEYIDELNSSVQSNGEAWKILNTLELYETQGVRSVKTYSMTTVMNSDEYDSKLYFRPIAKNFSTAVSGIVVYTMKLQNTLTGETIVRKASAGIPIGSLQKYGLKISSLNIDDRRPLKVYNKTINIKKLSGAVNSSTDMSVATSVASTPTTYRDVYTNSFNICANTKETETLYPGNTYHGQSQLTIYISKFDNVFNFKMYDLQNYEFFKKKVDVSLLSMQFVMDNGTIKSFPAKAASDSTATNEFVVTVDKVSAATILKQTHDKNFYIIETASDSSLETVMYTGMWKDISERPNELYTENKSLIEWIVESLKKIDSENALLDARKAALDIYKKELDVYRKSLLDTLNSLKDLKDGLSPELQERIDEVSGIPNYGSDDEDSNTSNSDEGDNSDNDNSGDGGSGTGSNNQDSNNTKSLADASSSMPKC